MKLTIGIILRILVVYLITPVLFRAMKKHNYQNLYQGLQQTKKDSGAVYQREEEGAFLSYSDKYVLGVQDEK